METKKDKKCWNNKYIYVTGMEKGLQRDKEVWSSCSNWGSGVDAGRCAYEHWWFWCTCSEVFLPEDQGMMIMTSLCDVTSISHAIEGGNYKRKA